jgi:hypothetical protein
MSFFFYFLFCLDVFVALPEGSIVPVLESAPLAELSSCSREGWWAYINIIVSGTRNKRILFTKMLQSL